MIEGKTFLITGANSGIGLETARAIASMGGRVVMVCRNPKRGESARAEIAKTAAGPVDLLLADLASLDSVRALAAHVIETYPRIDVFISNAGVFSVPHRRTVDGYEMTFAVNHLAPFLLTHLLRDHLRASEPARVVVVASAAHVGVTMPADPLAGAPRGWRAYQRSKLANVMFTYALARRLDGTDITANCLHPGFVRSRFGSGNGIPMAPVYLLLYPFTISATAGAQTSIYLATSDEADGMTGLYFDRSAPAPSSRASNDVDAQEKLWELSARLTGVPL